MKILEVRIFWGGQVISLAVLSDLSWVGQARRMWRDQLFWLQRHPTPVASGRAGEVRIGPYTHRWSVRPVGANHHG